MGEICSEAPTTKAVIDEIMSWKGTKWMHGVAIKGYRADCIQFIVEVARTFGWVPQGYKAPKYNRDYALHNATSLLEHYLPEIAYKIPEGKAAEIGDVIVFPSGRTDGHTGIYIGKGAMVHCAVGKGVVLDPIIITPSSIWRFHTKRMTHE